MAEDTYMTRCSASLVIRQKQIKTSMRHHYMPWYDKKKKKGKERK